MNNLTVQVYEQGSTSPIYDDAGDSGDLSVEYFETFYPGGIFGAAQIRVNRGVLDGWRYLQVYPYRVVIRNGLSVVYEGYIDGHERGASESEQYISIPLTGAWGVIAMRRRINRWYADNRTDNDAWRIDYQSPPTLEKFRLSRQTDAGAALSFSCQNGVVYINAEAITVRYRPPSGEKIRRVTFSYDFAEYNSEAWKLELYDYENGTSLWSVTATGSGTQDISLSTTSNHIGFGFTNNKGSSQTAAQDASGNVSYGEITNLVVYAYTVNTTGGYTHTLNRIAYNSVSYFSEISTYTGMLNGATDDLTPFITRGFEPLADILTRAAGYGDSSYNAYACYFRESEAARDYDGKPVLVVERQPALTDYDYEVSYDGLTAQGLTIEQDFSQVANYIVVQYQDENGLTQYRTPTDNPNLEDSDSQNRYGRRDHMIRLGKASSTSADLYGVRYLREYRYSKYIVSAPIMVNNYILDKNGLRVPVSEIRSGKRVRITNYTQDISKVSDTRLTFLITRTRYNDAGQSCQIYTGTPDELSVVVARLTR